MRLYEGSITSFIENTVQNRVAEELRKSFEEYYSHRASSQHMLLSQMPKGEVE